MDVKKVAEKIERQIENNWKDLNISLFNGMGSLLEYYYILHSFYDNGSYLEKIRGVSNQILENINKYEFGDVSRLYSFSNGLSGICFILTELSKKGLIEFNYKEDLIDINEYLYESAIDCLKMRNCDFLHGSLGVFYYFLFQPINKKNRTYLTDLFNGLVSNCRIDEDGLRIHNQFSSEFNTQNHFDMGIAHGLAGFLLVLVECIKNEINSSIAARYLNEGLKYILSLEKEIIASSSFSLFPTSIMEPNPQKASEYDENYQARLAWCYGDLNVAWVLIRSGGILKSSTLYNKGVDVALKTLNRKTEKDALVGNMFFCHGKAGLSYFYKRLHDITNLESFLNAHIHWKRKIFKASNIRSLDDNELLPSSSFFSLLDGVIGLILPNIINTSENDIWNKTFLLQ